MLSLANRTPRHLWYGVTAILLLVLVHIISSFGVLSRTKALLSGHSWGLKWTHGSADSNARSKPPTRIFSDAWRKALYPDKFNKDFEHNFLKCKADPSACPKNWDKIILLEWKPFVWTLRGGTEKDHVWCGSMMDSLYKLGYTMLVSTEWNAAPRWYQKYHENVHMIISGEHDPCVSDSKCIFGNIDATSVPPPNGTHFNIPIWKIFHANWENSAVGALGSPFTLSPEPYGIGPPGTTNKNNNFYLGYTVETPCLQTRFIPSGQRLPQAYLMGKSLNHFMDPKYILSNPEGGIPAQLNDTFYREFADETKTTFLAGRFNHAHSKTYTKGPKGIIQHPRADRAEFHRIISTSQVMVGLGSPVLSPTAYEGLCLGIPFINPITRWNETDPTNRTYWEGQHTALIQEGLDEPYVYHVKVGDREGLKAALRKAMRTPIERFIPPRMTSEAVVDRMRALMETDWKPVAKMQMKILGYRPPQ